VLAQANARHGRCAASLTLLLVAACAADAALLDEERDRLLLHALGPTPDDPSNAFADSAAAAALGKRLFFDRGLAGPLGPLNDGVTRGSLGLAGELGKVACVDCHDLRLGGADVRSRPGNTSFAAGYGARNAPTIVNAALADVRRGGWQEWDGGSDSLWSQPLRALEQPLEQNSTRLRVAHRIADRYRGPYTAVFGALPAVDGLPPDGKPGQPAFDNLAAADQQAVNAIFANAGKALAAYQRLLVSAAFEPAPFDRFLAGDDAALSPAARRGAALFIGRGGCDECHRGPQFADQLFHNTSVPQLGDNVPEVDRGRDDGVARLRGNLFRRSGPFSDDRRSDPELTATAEDLGAFKTPTLRNVDKTAPYMHNGVFDNLRDVVEHYNAGGTRGLSVGDKDVAIVPLALSPEDVDDLVAFLKSLSDGAPRPSTTFPEGLVAPP
jgi:cytochrome c peroxidase